MLHDTAIETNSVSAMGFPHKHHLQKGISAQAHFQLAKSLSKPHFYVTKGFEMKIAGLAADFTFGLLSISLNNNFGSIAIVLHIGRVFWQLVSLHQRGSGVSTSKNDQKQSIAIH